VPKQLTYFAKLFSFSCFLHLVLFVGLFCIWQAPINHELRLVVNRKINAASVVVLPMIKTVPGSLAVLAEQQAQDEQRPVKKIAQSKPAPPNKASAVQKKLAQKPPAEKTALAKSEPTKPKPSVVKKTTNAVKKVEKKSPQVVKKQETKKVPSPAPQLAQKKILTKDQIATTTQNQSSAESEIIYVGRDDMVLLKNHQLVQQDIERLWKPPVGLSKDLMCTVAVSLNGKGIIQALAVEESSNVLSYDITARMAL